MALFVLSLCPFDISVGIGAFVIGLGQISSFLSLNRLEKGNIPKILLKLKFFEFSYCLATIKSLESNVMYNYQLTKMM